MTIKEIFMKKRREIVAIHCSTNEQAKKVCAKFKELGLVWADGDEFDVEKTYWDGFFTCYIVNNFDVSLNSYGRVKECMYKIIEFDDLDDFKKEENKMSKFKVGDRVRVKANLKDFDWNEHPFIDESMLNYAGKEFTVTEINDNGHYILCDNRWSWNEKWLESVETVETPRILDDVEFKYLLNIIKPFMNEVKGIRKVQHFSSFKECIKIYMSSVEIVSLPYFEPNTMYKGMELCRLYTLEELGFVEPKPTLDFKFKVGDLVKVTSIGYQYSTYVKWFKEHHCEYLEDSFTNDLDLDKERDYVVVAFGGHSVEKNRKIYAIKDIFGNVFLIGEAGIEKIERGNED